MFRSQPIPMIQENKQLSVTKLAFCYQYKNDDIHNMTSPTDNPACALEICIKGIDKNGNHTAIAFVPLVTDTTYKGMTFAACVAVGIPVADYPSIYWEYDMSKATDFLKIVGQPIMFADVREYPDILADTTYSFIS